MSDATRPGFEGGLFLPFKGAWPRIGNDVFIAPTATVIGDVEIEDEAVIMYGCTVRGDTNWIKIGKRSNLQDHVVIHVNEGGSPTSIGQRVSVGHSVLLHACELQDGCLIGMRASVMDDAVVESGAMVAGGAVVASGVRAGGPAPSSGAGSPVGRISIGAAGEKWVGKRRQSRMPLTLESWRRAARPTSRRA